MPQEPAVGCPIPARTDKTSNTIIHGKVLRWIIFRSKPESLVSGRTSALVPRARPAASAELEEPGRGQVWELPDGRLYQHGGNRPFLLAVSSRVRIPLK